ncbi:LysR family transcriptional regulator [Eubacteriales bacterium OttesenSCG-928-N14]|nr:LysR family transcriptional regulator [Eubacteriales bacterium OttesenSCG-928-N14]
MLDPKLSTLLSVAQTMNFTRTAEELSLTQPAVSQHIKALEKELNIRIFNRSQKELILTEEGRITVEYARKMRSLYHNLQLDIEDEQRSLKRLTVGVTQTAESSAISQILAIYGSENPKLHITIITDIIKNLYDKLRSYELDLAIVEGTVADGDLNSILLDTDHLVLAVANDNPLSAKSMVTLAELKKEKLILRLPDSGTRTLFEQSLHSSGDSINAYNVILEVDNNNTIKELVQSGFGVSILSRAACEDYVRKNKFKVLPVENLSMIREINIVYHRDFRHVDMINALANLYNGMAVEG